VSIKQLTKAKVSLILKNSYTNSIAVGGLKISRVRVIKVLGLSSSANKTLTLKARAFSRKRVIKTFNKIKLFIKLSDYSLNYSSKYNQLGLAGAFKEKQSAASTMYEFNKLSYLLASSPSSISNNLLLSKSIVGSPNYLRRLTNFSPRNLNFNRLDNYTLQPKVTP
jgi:hypothetical protein